MTLRIVTALILIPLALALVFAAPVWLFLLGAEFFMLACVWELFRMFPSHSARGFPLVYGLTGAGPWIWTYWQPWFGLYLLAGALSILLWSVIFCRDVREGLPSSAANLLAFLYLCVPFSIMTLYHPRQGGREYDWNRGMELALIMAIIWAADAGAYFIGRWFGRHKISPLISPNKSLEGYVASVLAASLAAALVGGAAFAWPVAYLLPLGAALGLAGVFGDLFESLLKRSCGVKDSSNLIPGHGGVLDRLDSLLFAVPVYYLFSTASKMFSLHP